MDGLSLPRPVEFASESDGMDGLSLPRPVEFASESDGMDGLSLPRPVEFSMDSVPDDLIVYILLRIPEADLLAPMAAVCKTWRRLISDEQFPRRHRRMHGIPRVLGFVYGVREAEEDRARFSPTTAFVPATTDHIDLDAVDARHGRVLLHSLYSDKAEERFVVWSPIDDAKAEIPAPKFPYGCGWNASIFCIKPNCEHFNCHGGPFGVAFVGMNSAGLLSGSIYRSDSKDSIWSDPASADVGNISIAIKPAALVGSKLFMITQASRGVVLQYNFEESQRSLRIISPPSPTIARYTGHIVLPGSHNSLQFAALMSSCLRIWVKDADLQGTAPWLPLKSIDLWTRLPALLPFSVESRLVGFAGSRLVFFCTAEGVFRIDLSSGRVREVSKTQGIQTLIPYTCF